MTDTLEQAPATRPGEVIDARLARRLARLSSEVAIIPFVSDQIDFLSADAHKWLLGPCGAGFLYVKKDLQAKLNPPVYGWHNVRNPNFVAQETIEFRSGAAEASVSGDTQERLDSIEGAAPHGVHDLEAFTPLRNHVVNHLGRILKIAVHHHRPLPPALREPGRDCSVLAKVPAEPECFHRMVAFSQRMQSLPGSIG